jgi:diaminohydroxyphosphoribosylaminopyrimidine deaminase / 5-amino-6-(5-phosphoribosylamino)uracil reductase
MRRALALASKGRFTVWPNPRVGCVIVQTIEKEPRVIGEGYHLRKGEPHAERNALAACSENPAGATMYVTLEPCCHHGATPPCTEAILQAGIKRVVAAILDPFPAVAGKGVEWLRKNGVDVITGTLEEDAWYENRFFFQRHTQNKPWVLLKTAMTLDGKTATHTGHSQWITGEESRAHVHCIRAEMDAILVGIGTALSDNPMLTARPHAQACPVFIPPIRIVLDTHLRLPLDSNLAKTASDIPVWIFCSMTADTDKITRLEKLGVRVIPCPQTKHGLDLLHILSCLAQQNILGLMLEGGSTIHTAFLANHLVNEVLAYIAPILAGGNKSPSFYMGQGVATMNVADRLQRVERLLFGNDTLIRGILPR